MAFSTVLVPLFLLAILFAADSPAAAAPAAGTAAEWDALGNRYPAACRRDLSAVDAPVVRLPEPTFRALAARFGGREPMARLYGFVAFGAGRPVIYLNADMRPRHADDPRTVRAFEEAILHHERCHVHLKDLTGNPSWHPPFRGRPVGRREARR